VLAVNDDWRLRVTLLDHDHADTLAGSFAAGELESDLEARLQDRVVISGDGSELFLYAGTREALEGVQQMIEPLAAEHKWEPEFELKRWHPVSEEWEDPDLPLPTTADEQAAEHAELIEREREEAQEQGFTEYELRIECASHGDATRLAEQLESEGLPHVRRWRYVIVSASDEDSAKQLADRLTTEAPEGAQVTVEGTADATLAGRPWNRFALFGGLGG
jgi:hypothetical protein